jgi:2,3-bisphosphoglycerate-dependent phosphoglycerate mutase
MSSPVLATALPTLWLVRHGESTWNTAGLVQGHNDQAELTERGLRQAAEAAEQFRGLPLRAIYASDLRRAQQTAAAFSAVLGLPARTDERLRERNLGVLEGTRHSGVDPAVLGHGGGLVTDPDARPAGGESIRDLYQRAAGFCDYLAGSLPDIPPVPGAAKDVLVIAHGGTVRVLDAYLHGVSADQMNWRAVENATIVRIPEFGSQSRGENR